jgi:HEAT repeat protein
MGNQQILVLFLKALVAAKKSLALYPPGSQMAQEWIQRLHRSLRSFFQEGMSFPIRVGKDRFMWEGEELLMLDPALEAFRFDLESRGIAEFSIDPQVEDWELERFLDLLNQPATSLESLAGAAEYLRAKNVIHVNVRGPGLGRRGAAEEAGVAAEAEQDELELLVEAVLQKLAEQFTDLAYDRMALLNWLVAVSEGGVDVLVRAVQVLGGLAEGTGDRELRVRTLAEALLALPDAVRRPFLTTWLVPAAGNDLLPFNLLTQLTEDEMGEVARLVPDEELMALTAALHEFPWEEGKRHRLLEAIAFALQRKGSAEAPLDVAILSRDDPLLMALREEVTQACQSDHLLQRTVEILLAGFRVENEEYPGFALDALEEMSGEAIARGRLDLALDILKTLAGASHLGREWMREHPRRFAQFQRRAGGRTHITLLAGLLRGGKGAEQMPLAAEYLRLVGREAVEEFTTLLSDEKSRRVRARMCQILATVGPSVIPVLLRWLEDGRWYVVRNAVAILGRIGDQSAFLPVVSQLDHAHVRVRLEAVRALGLIGGRAAVGPLIRCLRDPDAEIRSAAVKVLGSLQDDDAVPALCDIVNRKGRDSAEELAFKREAIAALVATGTDAARQALGQLATRRLWFWRRAERRVRAMAVAALAGATPPSSTSWSDDA